MTANGYQAVAKGGRPNLWAEVPMARSIETATASRRSSSPARIMICKTTGMPAVSRPQGRGAQPEKVGRPGVAQHGEVGRRIGVRSVDVGDHWGRQRHRWRDDGIYRLQSQVGASRDSAQAGDAIQIIASRKTFGGYYPVADDRIESWQPIGEFAPEEGQ